jgi:hypothetical protein
VHRIRAQERERKLFAELVPKGFQPLRAVAVAFRPQERHHLAERPDTRVLRGARDEGTHDVVEALLIRRAAFHELRERGRRVERNVASRGTGER